MLSSAKCRLGSGEIAIVEIESEGRAEIIADAGDPLIAELPGAVVDELPDPRQLHPVGKLHRPDPNPKCGVIGQPSVKSYSTLVMIELVCRLPLIPLIGRPNSEKLPGTLFWR